MCCVLFGPVALLCLCGNRTVKQWSQKMFKAKLVLKDRKCLHVFLRVGQARRTVFEMQFYIEKPHLGTIH